MEGVLTLGDRSLSLHLTEPEGLTSPYIVFSTRLNMKNFGTGFWTSTILNSLLLMEFPMKSLMCSMLGWSFSVKMGTT